MTRNATQAGVDAYLRQRAHGKAIVALGVDPGIGHTGWAVILWPTRRIVDIGTEKGDTRETVAVLVEAVMRHKPEVVGVQAPAVTGKRAAFWNDKSPASLIRNAIFSGTLHGAILQIAEQATWLCRVLLVEPRPYQGLKAPRERWETVWDYTGRTSEDARDAAEIARMACEAKEA